MGAQSQLSFEILLTINGISYSDISFCAFIRSPILKQSSFCLVKLFFSQPVLRQMISDIDRNKFPSITMTIYSKDEGKTKGNTNVVFVKTFLCIKVTPEGAIRFQEDKMFTTLVLVHPTLYYLGNNNTYNNIQFDKKAGDVLGGFEGFLSTNFGEIFKFNHIGADVQKNEYIYEEILTRAKNDLNVPSYLINNYKVNNTFSYYFFDSFAISESDDMEIANYYINLFDKTKFKKVDVFEYFDRQVTSNKILMKNLSDTDQTLIGKRGNRYIFKHQEIKYSHEKEPKITSLDKKLTPISTDFKMVEERKIKSVIEQGVVGIVYGGSSATTIIYCPDEPGNGQARFDNAIQLVSDKIMGFQYYEMSNCLPDFPQFGEIYNLEEHNESNFVLSPLNIVNVFYRKNQREHYLYHLAKTVMLRYKND